MSEDEYYEYRVWPDETIQETSFKPYEWMSDDFVIITAMDEGHALYKFRKGYYN